MSSDLAGAWRAFLRAANGLAARRAERLWALSCTAGGRLLGLGAARRWSSTGDERVMLLAPHPDDELACAGTLIRHRAAGDQVCIVTATDGRLSRAHGFDPPSIAERRREEADVAAARLGAELRWLGFPEGNRRPDDLDAAIDRALADAAPTIVYAPSLLDYHAEHQRVARSLASALRLAPSIEVRIYGIQVPLTSLLSNLVHDVSDLAQPMRAAYAAHATQRHATASTMRLKRYAARLYGAGTLAEAFCAMPGQLYANLQARRPATFRAVRRRAWTDPLAALTGWRERIAWQSALRTNASSHESLRETFERP